MIGGLQGEFGELDIKYLKQKYLKIFQNVDRTYREASGEHRGTVQNWLRNSQGKRCRRIWICLIVEVETPSFPIRICLPDVKYLEKVECHLDRIPNVGYPEKMERRKRDRPRVHGVGTPTPDDTEHASLSRTTPSRFPKQAHGACEHHTPGR